MADENVIIEENEQNVGEYDPNPYDNVTVEEALKQLFNRFTPRTVRQAIFTMAENNKPATLIEKSITDNGEYNASADNADGYSSVTVDVPTEDSYVYLAYGTFTNNWPNPSTISTFVGDVGVLKVDDGNAVVDCVPRDHSGREIVISYIIINGTVNTINITRGGYPVSLSFKAGANISEFTVLGTTVVPTGAEITAGNWYNALIQRVNGNFTVTVEMNNNLERTVVTPQQ